MIRTAGGEGEPVLNDVLSGSVVRRSGKGQARQRRKRLRARLPHDRGAMALDGALADGEIGGDILAWTVREDRFHDWRSRACVLGVGVETADMLVVRRCRGSCATGAPGRPHRLAG